jgi:Na+-transporting methylmalonyl-CoA/oxaloacetate decarboxylase beta subunit
MIGSSDGPTSIYTAGILEPKLLPVITIAAYSYMALVPLIQPPIMRALTTEKERLVEMPSPKRVTRRQKIVFSLGITLATLVFVPSAGSLIAMLMLGNLIRETVCQNAAKPFIECINTADRDFYRCNSHSGTNPEAPYYSNHLLGIVSFRLWHHWRCTDSKAFV